MLHTLRRIFRDCFTEDGSDQVYDIDAFGWALMIVVYVIISIVEHANFSPLAFSGGAAALLAGRQVADIFKKK